MAVTDVRENPAAAALREAAEQSRRLAWDLVEATVTESAGRSQRLLAEIDKGRSNLYPLIVAFLVPIAGKAVSTLADLRGESPSAVLDEMVQSVEWGPDEAAS